MNCLNNYIGIKYCNSPEPLSGLYINQLPGITLESIDKVSEKDNLNFLGVWKDVQARAWLRLQKDLKRALQSKYKFVTVKSNSKLKSEVSATEIASAAKYRGVVIDLGENSSFLSVSINSLSITFPEAAASLTVKIFDRDGVELDSITKTDVPACKNAFPVIKKYSSNYVFIAVDATDVKLFSSTEAAGSIKTCCECLCDIYDGCNPTIYGGESLIATPDVVDDDSNELYGFDIDFGAVCDFNSIICRNKTEFIDVWMYLLGAELMLERKFSTRLNRFTTIDKEMADDLNGYFTVEYEKALKDAVSVITIDQEDCCIECFPAMSQRVSLP